MSGLNDSIETLLELRDEAERAFSDPLGEDGVYMYDVRVKKKKRWRRLSFPPTAITARSGRTGRACLSISILRKPG